MSNDFLGGLGGLMKNFAAFMPQDDPNTKIIQTQANISELENREKEIYVQMAKKAYPDLAQLPEYSDFVEELTLIQKRLAAARTELQKAQDEKAFPAQELYANAPHISDFVEEEDANSEPLFASEEEYEAFKERHAKHKVKRKNPQEYKGDAFLGIDAGSTTTKAALIDNEGSLLYSYYGSNLGSPLESTITALKDMYSKLNPGIYIRNSTVTGYGEQLIKTALKEIGRAHV